MEKRTHYCGKVFQQDIDKKVCINGWVKKKRNLGNLVFIDVRDITGYVQIVIDTERNKELLEISEKVKTEYVVNVKGIVRERESKNDKIPTGYIEIIADSIEILNECKLPPFYIDDDINVDENLRLKYRYLDLRRPEMQQRMIIRHKLMQLTRRYFSDQNFLEVDTPLMMRSTPEGARDYLIPSRINKGKFYALPQSPQIYKQLLMISGFDRYFQIARCLRDEDLRADRQPEFTQIDMEMSFVEQEDILQIMENLMAYVIKEIKGVDIKLPIPRVDYFECIDKYGCDKPDLRFGLELVNLTETFKNSTFKVFSSNLENGGIIKAINLEGKASEFSRKKVDELTELVKVYGAKGLAFLKYEKGEFVSSIAKFLTDEEKVELKEKLQVKDGDIIFIVSDKKRVVNDSLAFLRNHLAKKFELYDKDELNLLFVVDFPMFEEEEDGKLTSSHHPFTSVVEEDLKYFETKEYAKIRSNAYDLVMNGYELGSGSIRIHESDKQNKNFEALNLSEEDIKNKFGFFVEALKYGTPPHGGMALGLDRIVMIFTGDESLRDVIPFPKTTSASCLMSDAPSVVDEDQLADLGIKLK